MLTPTKVPIGFNELPFELEINENKVEYAVMRELNGKDRSIYLDFVGSVVKLNESGSPVGMKSWKGSSTKLLSLCLWKAKLDDTGRPIETDDGTSWVTDRLYDEKALEAWPDRPLQFLHTQAIELSKLNEKEKETGND